MALKVAGVITLKANAVSRKHTYWLSFHICGMKGITLNDLQCTFYVKIQGLKNVNKH